MQQLSVWRIAEIFVGTFAAFFAALVVFSVFYSSVMGPLLQ